MSDRPSILVVGCGFPQRGLVRFCQSSGLHVIGADRNPRAIGRAYCDDFVAVSTDDTAAIVDAARAKAVDGVVTCGSDLALPSVAQACAELRLPFYASPETVERCTHKDLMRAAFAEGSAPSPRSVVAESLEDGLASARALHLPVVVKPVRGWGQKGVRVVRREDELRPACEAASAASASGAFLVEEFIAGLEYSVNAFTDGGQTRVLAISERIITHYPDPPGITFAETYPASNDDGVLDAVADAALRGVRALGVVAGPTYTQVRHGPRGAFIIETAHRLGGGLDPEVTLLASGENLYARIVAVALRETNWRPPDVQATRHGGAIGRFLTTTPGPVRSVTGVDDALAMPGVVDAAVYVNEGDTVRPLVDGSARTGHVLCVGTSRAEAEARAEAAAARIRIEVT